VPYTLDGLQRSLDCGVWDAFWVGHDLLPPDESDDDRSLLLRVCGHGAAAASLALRRVTDLDAYLA
jgi:hypothetical protein